MGLRVLDPADWLERDPDALAQIPRRRALLRERSDEVVASMPGSRAAQEEVLALVENHLEERATDAPEAPLAAAARLVAEDLCLMERQEDGYCLTAGVVCFPLHWSLGEKLGRPLGAIHSPDLAERIGTAMDRFFASLDPVRLVWRANWSLVDTPEPFLPPAHRGDATGFDPARPAATLWLRTERQTLRRLPRTRAVLFTIRTRIEPLREVLLEPGTAAALAARIREMPESTARYKGILPIRDALLDYLDSLAPSGGGSTPSGLLATG